jgi:tRNA(1-methyladenosine) methyltransferase and related methyltransferases
MNPEFPDVNYNANRSAPADVKDTAGHPDPAEASNSQGTDQANCHELQAAGDQRIDIDRDRGIDLCIDQRISLGQHVLLRAKGGREYFAIAGEGKLHTDLGIVDLGSLEGKSWGEVVASHKDVTFTIIKPRAPDLFRHMTRTGAPMMPKDIGSIIAYTGLCPTDRVLDAGTGSGVLAAYLGTIARQVITYEASESFAANARKNLAKAGIANVEVRNGDLISVIEAGEVRGPFDVVTLDMQEAAKAVPGCYRLLRPGGFLAAYSPFFEQATEVRFAVEKEGFAEVTTIITSEQELEVGKRGTRPSTRVGHTGFVTIARK